MTVDRLDDHRLVVYLFSPLTGDHRQAADGQLRAVWQACATRLGMTEPVTPSAPADPAPPAGQPPTTGETEGRRTPGPALREAWWDHLDDVACLSVTLSRTGQPDTSWTALYDEWVAATDGLALDALLGMAEVFTALISDPTHPDGPAHVDLATVVGKHLPAAGPLPRSWMDTMVSTRDGLTLWQVSPTGSDNPLRRLVVTAPSTRDTELGMFVWAVDPTPLPRYLLNATKLAYQSRVLRADRDGLHQQRVRINTTLDRLQQRITAIGADSDDSLRDTQHDLSLLQANTSGIIDALIQTRVMRRTVAIAAANLAAIAAATRTPDPALDLAVGPASAVSTTGARLGRDMFACDQTTAADLDQNLDDEAAYLDAAAQRAQHFADLTDRELTRRAQASAETARHRQERFSLTQTAILGTVLMALTAIQALGYQIPLPGPAKPAVIATLGAAALWLSSIALRLSSPTQTHPTHHLDHTRRPLFVVTAFGLFTATLTWFLVSLLAGHVSWLPATVATTVTASVVAFALGTGTATWLHHRRPARQPHQPEHTTTASGPSHRR